MQVKLRLVKHKDVGCVTEYYVQKKWLCFWIKQPLREYYDVFWEELRVLRSTTSLAVAEDCFARLSRGDKIGYIPTAELPNKIKVLKEFP